MTYAWTQDQLKLLTYGSTVEGVTVETLVLGGYKCWFLGEEKPRRLKLMGPSTLKPPSIEFIRELAKERWGKDVTVDRFHGGDPLGDDITVSSTVLGMHLTVYDTPTLDRYRAAVAAILALAGAGIGGGK